jgi:dUTP pyrophosphatase
MIANGLKIFYTTNNEGAVVPVYEHENDAGCSLRVVEEYTIYPMKRVLARTGLLIEIPVGFEAQIRPRSGMAWKHGLTVVNTPGTIDADYRGEIKVALINLGEEKVVIKKGDAVAQMKFSPVYKGHFIAKNTLSSTDRDAGGFGSTGR